MHPYSTHKASSAPTNAEEAAAQQRLQERVRELTRTEQPFDVFLCCKDKSDIGGRTKESRLLQQLYDYLCQQGYRVFFPHVTLDDTSDEDVTPYTLFALQTAKAMVVTGSRAEHFCDPQVQRSWEYYLQHTGEEKNLIPTYLDGNEGMLPAAFGDLTPLDLTNEEGCAALLARLATLLPDPVKGKHPKTGGENPPFGERISTFFKGIGGKILRPFQNKKMRIPTILVCIALLAVITVVIVTTVSSPRLVVVKNGVRYTFNRGTGEYVVSGCSETATDIVILDCIKKMPVTAIGKSAFSGHTGLTSVVIPNSIAEIGSSAFSECTALQSVTLPDALEWIPEYAFYNCTSLTSITLPESVKVIGRQAFDHCTSLSSITIPHSVTTIEQEAFSECTALQSVTLPDALERISEQAFYNCTALSTITIPASVFRIDSLAFSGCTKLSGAFFINTVGWIADTDTVDAANTVTAALLLREGTALQRN